MRFQLDMADERREQVMIRIAHYQGQLARFYNKRVHLRQLGVGDLVLRKVLGNTKDPADGKLGPNWEGPYRVVGKAEANAYKLRDMDGNLIPRTWNVSNLKKYYQ